jgi:hypothetical protein
MFVGLILIVIGVVALLVKLGVVTGSVWSYTWPILLILLGLSWFLRWPLLFRRRRSVWGPWCWYWGREEKEEDQAGR